MIRNHLLTQVRAWIAENYDRGEYATETNTDKWFDPIEPVIGTPEDHTDEQVNLVLRANLEILTMIAATAEEFPGPVSQFEINSDVRTAIDAVIKNYPGSKEKSPRLFQDAMEYAATTLNDGIEATIDHQPVPQTTIDLTYGILGHWFYHIKDGIMDTMGDLAGAILGEYNSDDLTGKD